MMKKRKAGFNNNNPNHNGAKIISYTIFKNLSLQLSIISFQPQSAPSSIF